METWQKIVFGIGVLLVILFVLGAIFAPEPSSAPGSDDEGNPDASVVYYYGDGCPACAQVQNYIDENEIVFGENLAKKEVWNNTSNSRELSQRASQCEIKSADVGVPFLWVDGECLIGSDKVIGYFEEE